MECGRADRSDPFYAAAGPWDLVDQDGRPVSLAQQLGGALTVALDGAFRNTIRRHGTRRKPTGMKRSRNKGLLAIALFKWLKGALLIVLAFGFLKLLHQDVAEVVEGFANKIGVDPDNRYLGAFLAKLNLLDDRKLKALSGLTFAYSALFLTEGTGLFFEKRWAEFLTIIVTASFMPLEFYELFKIPTIVKSLVLALNWESLSS